MSSIHELARLDLNLVVAFAALHEQGSVTRAAAELGVTQSAMSHTLNRLRDLLDDRLFVREGRRMVPTPRAAALAGPLRAHLEGLARALAEPDGFDPATTTRRFALASVDLFDALVMPALSARVAAEAPGVRLALRPHDSGTVARLDRGELDAAIHPVLAGPDPLPSGGLRRRTLLRDGFSVFCRADHPLAERISADLDAFCAAGHVLVTPGGGPGLVDRLLAERGLERRVAVELHQFAAALAVVAGTDLLLTAPSALSRLAGDAVRAVPPPMSIPEHAVTLVWSERMDADPGHRWFRRQVGEAVQAREP